MAARDAQHGFRVAYILVGVVSVALIARAWLIPPTFGLYGAYRGAAVREIMDSPVKYRGVANCKDCHLEQWNEWRESSHQTVACESCHGPGMDHSEPDIDPRPKIFGTKELMSQSRDLCLSCHAMIPGRRADHPQVDSASHPSRRSVAAASDGGGHIVPSAGTAATARNDQTDDGPDQAVETTPLPWEYSCVFCHADSEIFFGDKQHLLTREEDLLEDVHWQKGVRCHDCHGGAPVLGDFTPHENDPNFRTVKSPEDAPGFCGRCHFDVEYMRRYLPLSDVGEATEYLTDTHGRRRNDDGSRRDALCVSCHGFHVIRPVADLGTRSTCVTCHRGHDPARSMALF
jgi:hypothetical protein